MQANIILNNVTTSHVSCCLNDKLNWLVTQVANKMLPLKNTPQKYGLIAILFHWLAAIAVLALFATGIYMVELTYYDSLYNKLPAWHKSVGILLGLLMILRFIWMVFTTGPDRISGMGLWQWRLARIVHWVMLLLIVAIIGTGYLIPTAEGEGINVFDWFTVGALIQGYENQADIAGEIHEYLAYLVIGLVVLHTLAALKHHFLNKDRTLKRMLGL